MARGYPDFTGPKVGVYLQPEWAAKEGTDKNFALDISLDAGGAATGYSDYAVPTGKNLYLTQGTFTVYAKDSINGDLNQMGNIEIASKVGSTLTRLAIIGGNGGGEALFSVPIKIAGGTTLRVYAGMIINHAAWLRSNTAGYEI